MAGCRGLLFLLIVSSSALAQPDRYVVFFKDKNNNPYSLSQPQAFLSAKALTRRAHSGIALTQEDLPVTPSYVTQVRATGAKSFFTSHWMNAVLVEATPAIISSIVLLPVVLKSELVAPGSKLLGGRSKHSKLEEIVASSGQTDLQLQMLGLDKMHADGFYGEGVTVSIFDSGFSGVNSVSAFQEVFAGSQVKMTQDFISNSSNVYQFHFHGTIVFSVISAQLQGAFKGGANKANYLLFVTEDALTEYRIEEYNWLFAAEKADSAGTDVIQSSLGYDTFDDSQMDYKIVDLNGVTAVISKAAAMARDRGIIVVTSAGNRGDKEWHYITFPADVDGILAVGAVTGSGVKANFSSFGPTADGRIKPDVAALGENVVVVVPDGSIGTSSGTSLAAPLVTSLVAGLLQAYPAMKPADLVEAIKLSASQSTAPDNQLGFGLPHYTAVKNYIESNQSGEDIYVYPNPSASTLHLSFKKLPEGPVDILFYDSQGKQLANPVTSINWLSNPVEISLSNLSPGLYIIKVKTSTILKTLRFVKL